MNLGDFKKGSKYYEYKASGFNQNNSVNIVQIRLWQQCDYIIQSITYEEINTFLLKHNDMIMETDLCRASSAHGTKTANKDNKNKELRMTIYKESENWDRWQKKYLVNNNNVFNNQ